MTKLGQMLKSSQEQYNQKHRLSDDEVAAQEALRVESVRASFERVLEKAKRDISKAILKGGPLLDAKSRVPEREKAYKHLSERLRWLQFDPALYAVVGPMWDEFVAWAASEALAVTLRPIGILTSDGNRNYVDILVEPLQS